MGVYLTANRYALICFRDRILHLSDPKNTGLWQELRNAIRGTEADYTQIGLKRAILLLAGTDDPGTGDGIHLRGG
jgi:hypothetical protein